MQKENDLGRLSDLRVAAVQCEILTANVNQNLADIGKMLDSSLSAADVDLIVLPEVFASGFGADADIVCETRGGKIMTWLAKTADRFDAVVCGSMVYRAGSSMLNRMIWMQPDSSFKFYDKKHLFTMAGEHKRFVAGEERCLFTVAGWKVMPMICYDLRFPVWCRNDQDFDLQIFVANWPSPRGQAWRMLLPARAIENCCYSLGVNRIGKDHLQQDYNGDTAAYDFLGNRLTQEMMTPGVLKFRLDHVRMLTYREATEFLADRDPFEFN